MVTIETFKAGVTLSKRTRRQVMVASIAVITTWICVYPKAFADIWLTQNQQGYIFFLQGEYADAASRFSDVRWQAYSLYGAEKFTQSAVIFGQFQGAEAIFSQGNAYAHAGEYLQARDHYLKIPEHVGAKHNLTIVQKLIDDINRMSESQQPESGDAPKELGDAPRRADGAEKQEMRTQKLEQYSAEQLLLDPDLNAMWLRQVQKDPAVFLANKFNSQLQVRQRAKSEMSQPLQGAEHESR